jgi:hypothetical protein
MQCFVAGSFGEDANVSCYIQRHKYVDYIRNDFCAHSLYAIVHVLSLETLQFPQFLLSSTAVCSGTL